MNPLDEVDPQYKVPLEPWQQYELLGELRSARAQIQRLEAGRELREALVRVRRLERCREDLTAMVQEIIRNKKTTL